MRSPSRPATAPNWPKTRHPCVPRGCGANWVAKILRAHLNFSGNTHFFSVFLCIVMLFAVDFRVHIPVLPLLFVLRAFYHFFSVSSVRFWFLFVIYLYSVFARIDFVAVHLNHLVSFLRYSYCKVCVHSIHFWHPSLRSQFEYNIRITSKQKIC